MVDLYNVLWFIVRPVWSVIFLSPKRPGLGLLAGTATGPSGRASLALSLAISRPVKQQEGASDSGACLTVPQPKGLMRQPLVQDDAI